VSEGEVRLANPFVDRIEVFEGLDGWHYRGKAGNGETLFVSEAFSDLHEARTSAERLQEQISVDLVEGEG
jgi:hypothetical protein